jgi:hypothetical protein
MAMGCGLDSAIADAFDTELIRVVRVVSSQTPQKESDSLLINLHNLMQEFGEFEDLYITKKILKKWRFIRQQKFYSTKTFMPILIWSVKLIQ